MRKAMLSLLLLTLLTGFAMAQNGAVVIKGTDILGVWITNPSTGLQSISASDVVFIFDWACGTLGGGYVEVPFVDVFTPSGQNNYHINGPTHTGLWDVTADPCNDLFLAFGFNDWFGQGSSVGGTDTSLSTNLRSVRATIGGTLAETANLCDYGSDCCYASFGSGCDSGGCEAAVCAVDDYCCSTEWDVVCAIEATELCSDMCLGVEFNSTVRLAANGEHFQGPRYSCFE